MKIMRTIVVSVLCMVVVGFLFATIVQYAFTRPIVQKEEITGKIVDVIDKDGHSISMEDIGDSTYVVEIVPRQGRE